MLVLCVALAYSGVAWAVADCLTDGEDKRHGAVDYHDDSQPTPEQDASKHPLVPIIHCPSLLNGAAPVVMVASTTLTRSKRHVSLYESSLSKIILQQFKSGLWVQSVLNEVFACSSPTNSARRLFLCILQI